MKTIELNAANLDEIVRGAVSSIDVAFREYLRMLKSFPLANQSAIEAEGLRIFDAFKRGEPMPEGEPALQIAALFQAAITRAKNEIIAIKRGDGSGDNISSLYFLLSQQTGFLMALDAQSRGDVGQWNALRANIRSELASQAATARASQPGGSRENKAKVLAAWKTFDGSRDACAEYMSKSLGISFSTARKYLRRA